MAFDGRARLLTPGEERSLNRAFYVAELELVEGGENVVVCFSGFSD